MFQDWDNYFFLIGSAGAGLIGLLFVVMTLTAGFEPSQTSRGTRLYMTPSAIHFAVVLALSGVAVAPGLAPWLAGAIFGLTGLAGLAFSIRAAIGIRNPPPGTDKPHWTDFWTYGALPAVLYVAIAAAAVALALGMAWAVVALAALLMVLLLVGIRNAWDLVTYIASMHKPGS